MKTKIILVITLLSILPACAPVFKYEKKTGMPSALLTRNAESTQGASLFAIDDDGKCPLLGYVHDDKPLDLDIPAGKRIYVQVGYNTWGAPVGELCIIKQSFIPTENAHYYSEFKFLPSGCSLKIFRYKEDGSLVPEETAVREKFEMCMY